MASGFTSVVLQNILNAILGGATFVASVTGINVKLMTATGNSTSAGTELGAGGGYATGGAATQFGAFGVSNANASYSAPNCTDASTTPATQWTNMPACTISGAELWDRSGSPVRKMWADLTGGNKTVNSGDTFSFAIGALVGQIAG